MLDSLIVSPSVRSTLLRATDLYAQNVDQLASFLAGREIDRDAAIGHRLGKVCDPIPGHERFVGMMSIPYLTPGGVVAMKFRQLEDEKMPKYDAPSGQTVRLYNVAALQTSGPTVAICEGELDAIVMTHVVGIPAVGVPGASNWQPHWSRAFMDYDEVLVVADHDDKADGTDPGLKHAKRVVKEVKGARLVLPPSGLDLTEWVQKEGVETVRKACGL